MFKRASKKKKPEEPKLVWVKVSDDKDERISWIPALKTENKVISVIGELENPDSPEDTREFTDCPIPGFNIFKDEEGLENGVFIRMASLN